MGNFLYRALVGALAAGIIGGIAMLFKFLKNKLIGSSDNDEENNRKK